MSWRYISGDLELPREGLCNVTRIIFSCELFPDIQFCMIHISWEASRHLSVEEDLLSFRVNIRLLGAWATDSSASYLETIVSCRNEVLKPEMSWHFNTFSPCLQWFFGCLLSQMPKIRSEFNTSLRDVSNVSVNTLLVHVWSFCVSQKRQLITSG